ncbi:MAG: alpha/beta hydrolase [Bacteroidia bacterium]|nr:alpha/beta hydrolase [Bacteroidia bacterium]
MTRAIFEIKGIDIQVRKMGSGYPLILFHDSPRSSRMMLGLAEELKDYFTLIMPDTPGCGLSDVVPHTPHTMAALIPYFKELFLQMGLKKFGLYGIGTGAQIAIRYSLIHPEQVEHLFLDDAIHLTDKQFEKIKKSYFPDLSPSYDGKHLMETWTFIRDMHRYFPWFMREKKNRIELKEDKDYYGDYFLDMLDSGRYYKHVYSAAYNHAHLRNVEALKVKTSLFFDEGSRVYSLIKQLVDFKTIDNVEIIDIPDSEKERSEIIRYVFRSNLPQVEGDKAYFPPFILHRGQSFIQINSHNIHMWVEPGDDKMPLLLLPNPGESGYIWKEHMKKFSEGRTCVLISLPGQGESDYWEGCREEDEIDELCHGLMKQLGFSSFEIMHPGEPIPFFPIDPVDEYGAYSMKAWTQFREIAGDDPDPQRLQIILRERLKYV